MNRPSSVACTECRSRHLKCDAQKPSCSRCAEAQLNCVYLPSRRGGRRKAHTNRQEETTAIKRAATEHAAREPLGSIVRSPRDDGSTPEAASRLQSLPPQNSEDTQPFVPDSRLIRLYYENFHPAHPILVPPALYDERNYPPYLQQVVRFIGSQYSMVLSSDIYLEATVEALSINNADKTPCMVQALLLYSIIQCARNEFPQAEISFTKALDIALELGMYQKQFALTFSGNQEPEAESLRRTWWELFAVEVYMATVQRKAHLRCGEVQYDVPLPCEESQYASRETIPSPLCLDSFRMRVFMEDDEDAHLYRYSSYSYRIEAVHILARVLVLNSLPETHQDHLQAVANAIVSWLNHLPRHKIDIVDMYGNVDEMLFQSHVTIHYAAMLLHLPRSDLRPRFPDTGLCICPVTPVRLSPSLTRHVHDVKATEASKRLSNLLSVRTSAQGYSPFISYMLLLCGLVQLATSERHSADCADHHYNRVILVLGSLKILKRNWSLAQISHDYLRQAASQAIKSGKELRPSPPGSTNLPSMSRRESNTGNETAPTRFTPGAVPMNQVSPPSMFMSAYIDPMCNDQLLLNQMYAFDGAI